MKNNSYLFLIVLFLFALRFNAQLTVPSYTACPNQVVTVQATWNNVAVTSLTLAIPPNGNGPTNLGQNLTFTVSASAAPATFTLSGTGNNGGTVNSGPVLFNINIVQPPPLSIANTINYCPGTQATLTADMGGTTYLVSGPGLTGIQSFNTNILNYGPLTSGHTGVVTVTSVGTCTLVGTTTINVAPSTPITINSTSNVCQNGTVELNASLANGSNWEWKDNLSSILTPTNTPTYTITNIQPNQGGVYTVNADLSFNGILCPRTATTQINVVATVPVSAAASPNNILCQGDKLTLNAGAAGAYAFQWSGPAGFTTPVQNPVILPVGPQHTGEYSVTALFTNNFTTCPTMATVSVSIVPVTLPVPVIPGSVCEGATVAINATGGPNVVSWTWFGPGFSSNTQSTSLTNVKPNQSGSYIVTAVYAINSTTCAATGSTQLNVVGINSISLLPPAPVCQPNNAYLQANATNAVKYNWVGPNNYVAVGSNVTVYQPALSATGVYTVTASFGGGNLTCLNTNTVFLQVYPVLNFSLVPPPPQVCYNTTLQINGPPGATSYSWSSSTGLASTAQDIYFSSIQPKNTGSYTLDVFLGPCRTRSSVNIVVLDPISFTLTPNDYTICKGDTIVLEGAVTGGSQNYAYKWDPAIYLDSPTGPLKVVVPQGSIVYNLTVHDIACPSFSVAHPASITVKESPIPDLHLERSEGCEPFCMTYDAGIHIGGLDEGWNVIYDFGGIRKIQADSNSVINYCLPEGTYTLNVITEGKNGCNGVYPYPYPLVVNPGPGSDITWIPEEPTTNDEVVFYANSKYDPIIYHKWAFSGGIRTELDTAAIDTTLIPDPFIDETLVDSPRRKYESFGTYPVMLITTNDRECTDTVVKFLKVIDDMNIYIPNTFTPNGDGINDFFGVKGMGIKTEGFVMDLCDRSGTVFFSTKDVNETWDGKIGGQFAMNGVYIYKVKVVGMNGEGRKELVGYFTLLR
jgi:gliding motility-associated-like protein